MESMILVGESLASPNITMREGANDISVARNVLESFQRREKRRNQVGWRSSGRKVGEIYLGTNTLSSFSKCLYLEVASKLELHCAVCFFVDRRRCQGREARTTNESR